MDIQPRKRMKSGITRVRTGCYTCRRRKVKQSQYAGPAVSLVYTVKAMRYDTSSVTPKLSTLLWDWRVASRRETPSQQSLSPTALETWGQSTSSVSDTDNQTTVLQSEASALEKNESSVVDSHESSSQSQSNITIDSHLSPLDDAFLDTAPAWTWAATESFDTCHSMERMVRLRHTSDLSSSDDSTNPSDYGDSTQIPAISDTMFPNVSDYAYRASPLASMSDPSSLSDYYFSQWHNSVATLLPPVFRDITAEMPDFQPLRNAVLAISAAYVAHLESLIVRTAHRTRKSFYMPQKDHQYQSLQYYNQVIQGIGKCVEMYPQMNSLHVLAALLLSYYFELDSGSFAGGIGHMTVIDKFLSSHRDEIESHTTGQKLLSTWMNLRSQFVNRYLGSYIPSMSTHSIDMFPLNGMITPKGSHHDSITIMVCNCKLLSRKIILDWCVTRGESRSVGNSSPLDKILSRMSLPKARKESVSQLAAIDDDYWKSLEKCHAKLDEWHSTLELSELPIESYASQRRNLTGQSTNESNSLDILPLKFHTFEAAMNYAYYAQARMMCSLDVINRLRNPKFVVPPLTRKDCPWAELILRITAGLQISDCIYKNTFNAGILPILILCMVSCPRPDVASWIEGWIRKVEDFGVPLESGLPFGLIKRIIRFIINQRQSRRDVLLVLPLDTEDAEKSDLYQSDFRMHVGICGKDIYTGKLYNEIVEIPEV
ncbi:hypothetical protein TSTA_064940 [Talaromyces stipitatus ATCC 10500]|uniref:Uncharacterized protein n=1 Tax=Talaromyces stipitatus (strain ATCC 10500 / CBS 375.48 / QM 6759 / NRRL 1006) TaxID=441959 RepID=B8LTF5_TALSN|nr:uncharacterized protein TSTA_064940 [Talaromyces stipitatus ATCC 10500]EED23033.1 hypothetical protein TSTA_064940 [Talaromyces stipitatus ATCC 10500]